MIITKQQLDKIGTILDLEKIQVIPRENIVCFPKKIDEEFKNKFKEVEAEVKKISRLIDITIIEEGEIDNVKNIKFSGEISGDGFNHFGE